MVEDEECFNVIACFSQMMTTSITLERKYALFSFIYAKCTYIKCISLWLDLLGIKPIDKPLMVFVALMRNWVII